MTAAAALKRPKRRGRVLGQGTGAYGDADPGPPARRARLSGARSISPPPTRRAITDLLKSQPGPELGGARDRFKSFRRPADGRNILATPTRFNANRNQPGRLWPPKGLVREKSNAALRAGSCARVAGEERWVGGARYPGPTNKTLSLSPNVNDPGYREIDFDTLFGRLCRADRGPRPGRRGFHFDRDGVRYAECQGRDPRPARAGRSRSSRSCSR